MTEHPKHCSTPTVISLVFLFASFSFHFYHKKPGTSFPGFSFLKQDILHRMKIRT